MTTIVPPMRRKSLVLPVLFVVGAEAVLISLGVWQLHRLAWKEGLIAEIAARAKAPAQPLPDPSTWPRLQPADYDYRRVEVVGHFDNDKETLVFDGAGPDDIGPGYLVLTPLRLDSGAIVIVNRGFVPAALVAKSARAEGEIAGEVHLAGLMRPPQPRNFFTPADTPEEGIYFTRDPGVIAAHFGLAQAAPFIVDADATPVPGGWPRGGMTEIDIPNDHLNYALTWFGLAAGLFCVFAAYLFQHRRGERPAKEA
jgi:surfeit locus 1 family protein